MKKQDIINNASRLGTATLIGMAFMGAWEPLVISIGAQSGYRKLRDRKAKQATKATATTPDMLFIDMDTMNEDGSFKVYYDEEQTRLAGSLKHGKINLTNGQSMNFVPVDEHTETPTV